MAHLTVGVPARPGKDNSAATGQADAEVRRTPYGTVSGPIVYSGQRRRPQPRRRTGTDNRSIGRAWPYRLPLAALLTGHDIIVKCPAVVVDSPRA
jgi:hypothetical protein